MLIFTVSFIRQLVGYWTSHGICYYEDIIKLRMAINVIDAFNKSAGVLHYISTECCLCVVVCQVARNWFTTRHYDSLCTLPHNAIQTGQQSTDSGSECCCKIARQNKSHISKRRREILV